MVLDEEQEKELREARKIASRSPKYNPTIHQWRTFRAQFRSWLNMTGISRMGEQGAESEQIEFAKLCLEASMESTAIDRIEQYRVGTAAAAAF